MKLFLAVAVLVSVLAAVSANIFGQNNALNNKFPGSKPISVDEYNKLVQQQQQQQAQRPTPTPSPNPNWMFETSTTGTVPPGGRRQATSVRGDSDEEDVSGEDE